MVEGSLLLSTNHLALKRSINAVVRHYPYVRERPLSLRLSVRNLSAWREAKWNSRTAIKVGISHTPI